MSEQLGRFALLNRIGSGGMAEVFLARGPTGMCVVKRLHARLAEDPDLVRMFLDEASLAAQLSHPGIARVFELGESKGFYFFAMEYVPGFDLFTILGENAARKVFMGPEVAARIAADLAAALHHAHEAVGARGQKLGIVHRDVSPQNVLISTMGQVKLIDFGVARATSKMHQTRAGLVKGKAAYMAPEQVVGAAIDRRVDVYALGLLMFEMLTNHRAIVGEQEMEIILNARAGKLNELTEFRHDVPEPVRHVMMKALSFRADARYPTADAARLELEAWLERSPLPSGRDQLAALLNVVPADPNHHVEPESRDDSRPGDSTLRPSAPQAPRGLPAADETFKASRKVSRELLLSKVNTDGSPVTSESGTDVERKGLGSQGRRPGPVPDLDASDRPTAFSSGAKTGPVPAMRADLAPTIMGNSDLVALAHAAGKAMLATEKNAPVESPPLGFEAEGEDPEHITEKPDPRVGDATLPPQRSKGPMVLVLALLVLGLGAVAFLFLMK